jgi:hypothetical protein
MNAVLLVLKTKYVTAWTWGKSHFEVQVTHLSVNSSQWTMTNTLSVMPISKSCTSYKHFIEAVLVSDNLTLHSFVKFRSKIPECMWTEGVTMQLVNTFCVTVKKCHNSNKIKHFILTFLASLHSQTDANFRYISSNSDSVTVPHNGQPTPYCNILQLTATHVRNTHTPPLVQLSPLCHSPSE